MAAEIYGLFWLNLALLSVCGGGIILNVFSAVVLTVGRKSIPGARILLGLGLTDAALLISITCRKGITQLCFDINYLDLLNLKQNACPRTVEDVFYDPILDAVIFWLYMAGTYLVVALATRRYMAVEKPAVAQEWNGVKNQRISVLLVYAFATFVTLPNFFEGRGVYTWDVAPHNQMGNVATWYGLLYAYVYQGILHYVIPLPYLFILNIRFLRGLKRFHNRRRRLSLTVSQSEFTSSREMRATLNVAAILIVFLLCQSASLAVDIYIYIYYSSFDSSPDVWYTRAVLSTLSSFFVALNSSTNFWIYLVFLKDFREAALHLITCAACRM